MLVYRPGERFEFLPVVKPLIQIAQSPHTMGLTLGPYTAPKTRRELSIMGVPHTQQGTGPHPRLHSGPA